MRCQKCKGVGEVFWIIMDKIVPCKRCGGSGEEPKDLAEETGHE